MARITELIVGIYRISIYLPQANMQFNHFLIVDEQPLLYHTGTQRMFPDVLEAVGQIMDPTKLRWIGFSHYEVDECGALNEWLDVAETAQAIGTVAGVQVNLVDFASRPPRGLKADERIETGRFKFRMIPTPHLPHGWDAGMFFEETTQILFCSDLFHQNGDVEPVTRASVLERARQVLLHTQGGLMPDYMPYTLKTKRQLEQLAALKPKMLATQHGSTFTGDGGSALQGLAAVIKEAYEYNLL
jgi:flavorubredoxin